MDNEIAIFSDIGKIELDEEDKKKFNKKLIEVDFQDKNIYIPKEMGEEIVKELRKIAKKQNTEKKRKRLLNSVSCSQDKRNEEIKKTIESVNSGSLYDSVNELEEDLDMYDFYEEEGDI